MDNRKATLELGTKPVGKLLLQYALPAIIAMTASSLYNMIDSIFIGQGVGPMAISGLAITFPFMNISAAFGAAIGVGASTCISVRLGQKDYSRANHILGNTVVLNLIIGLFFATFALLFLDEILRFFGATDNTISYARDYMVIILLGNMITHEYFGLNAVLRAASKPRHAMYATIFTVVLNTILDPIFIYTFDMGIRGAAIATVLSQTVALCWQIKVFSNQNELLHLERRNFKLDSTIVKNIISIGISPFAMNTCACIVVIFINTALVRHGGDLAVGAYGIANRIGFFFFMIVMGLNQGMQPIAGYNYGAQQIDRMLHVLQLTIISAVSAMTLGWLISEFLTRPCVSLFTTDEELIRIAIHGVQINSLFFPLIGYQAVVTNFFQSIGIARMSIFLSLSRQLLFLLPLLIVLPPIMGVDGVWWSLPASDFVAFIVTLIIMIRYMKKFRDKQAENS
ncbi:MAG: MATE family efflux transporter [Prevotella sp.]|nr:MATE family efflux transporter [Prevotella sp.]